MSEKPVGMDGEKIADIAEKRKKKHLLDQLKEAPPEEKKKLGKADKFKNISLAINRSPHSTLPKFNRRFYVVEASVGVRLICMELDEPDFVEYVPIEKAAQTILRYVHDWVVPSGEFSYKFTYDMAMQCATFWLHYTSPVPEPKMVTWRDEPGLSFRKLPWSRGEGPSPLFDDMFKRISNAEALRRFIGSLFVEKADRQQYVWLHGQGNDGKGTLSRFLKKALNGAYRSQETPQHGDKFWTSGLLGARLVVFPDCNNSTFVTTGLFKSMTGGDPLRIEMKRGSIFTAELTCKYMFMSNEKPKLSSERADKRRIILCEMSVIPQVEADFEERLWSEGGYFLTKCLMAYEASNPKHGPIVISDDENIHLDDWISTVEEGFETVFADNFKLGEALTIKPADLHYRLQRLFKNSQTEHEFRVWMQKKHGVRKMTVRKDSLLEKVYKGAELIPFGDDIPPSQCSYGA